MVNFSLDEAIELLERTPQTLSVFLSGLSEDWLKCREGEGTWNAAEVIAHLIEAERSNWIPRLEHILREGEDKPFPAFDRFAHLARSESPESQPELLEQFRSIRSQNIHRLEQLVRTDEQLEATGSHPAFGIVKARELIATWAVHDLTHTAQIVRVMANRYREDVGPWVEYLGILQPCAAGNRG